MRRCGACRIACRAGTRERVWLARGNRLVRSMVCKACASGAVPLLMAQPVRDATICVECKDKPARLCDGCNLRSRTAAAKEAIRATSRSDGELEQKLSRLQLEPKEDL